MTDTEIDAVLRPVLAKAWDCLAESVIIYGDDRLAYRAGMREAARIARELALKFVEPVCEIGALRAVDAIERAAGGEG